MNSKKNSIKFSHSGKCLQSLVNPVAFPHKLCVCKIVLLCKFLGTFNNFSEQDEVGVQVHVLTEHSLV